MDEPGARKLLEIEGAISGVGEQVTGIERELSERVTLLQMQPCLIRNFGIWGVWIFVSFIWFCNMCLLQLEIDPVAMQPCLIRNFGIWDVGFSCYLIGFAICGYCDWNHVEIP